MSEKFRKAITFSYDDGVCQDRRLVEILNRYGLKGTFNLNSARFGMKEDCVREGVPLNVDKISAEEVRTLYEGHEVAAHTLHHPMLPEMTEEEIIREVEEDRIRLSELSGTEVVGMAYPGGGVNFDSRVSEIVRTKTNIRYARTTVNTDSFYRQQNLYEFKPNVCHIMETERLYALAEEFLNLQNEEPAVFYIWGHSYEFDIHDTWDEFEQFCRMISGRPDVFYGTNREVLL